MSKHDFQTEVSQLLHLIIHSLYSHSEIFLRELVSNASDALDKLKYLTLTEDQFKTLNFQPRIDLEFNEKENTLTISDSGIGMNAEDLAANLGTIARSGTKHFLSKLSGDQKKDSNLIGQFGVGFYSAFMVADRLEVISKKAGEDKAWRWTSNGKDGYEIEPAEREGWGTSVIVAFNNDGKDYSSAWKIKDIVKRYSNHIAFPIYLTYDKTEWEGTGEDAKKKEVRTTEQINSASALWKKSKSELKDEDYKEFYKTLSGDWEEPMTWIHAQAEGTMEYTTLFYIPKKAPFDMFNADYKPGVKLYVKRVFITDDEKELMPTYLRFLRGVIDSEDLPLNVSREILQQNKILNNIKTASVKKVLSELQAMAQNKKDQYIEFISEFNRPLKEGLYSDFANKEALMELVRFKSTKVEGWTGLEEYKNRMAVEQKSIYYITGGTEAVLRNSPLLEAYKKKDIEVLIMSDEIDEIVVPTIGKYKDLDIKAINKSGAADDLKDESDKAKEKEIAPLVDRIKKALGDKVKDVKASTRLTDSPACIITDENDPTMQMQQMLKAMGQKDLPSIKPILEINPEHEIVKKLNSLTDETLLSDAAFLLLEQSLLLEGMTLESPSEFAKRLNRVMARSV